MLEVKYCFILIETIKHWFAPKRLSNKTAQFLLRLFGKNMNQTLLKKIFVSAVILSTLVVGQVYSQQAAPTPLKRNSPFSPNPKKKVEEKMISQNAEVTNKNVEPANDVTMVQVESNNPNVENAPILTEQTKDDLKETTNPTTEEFKSRSVAAKTLEVAKRAVAVEVSPTEIYKVGVGDILFISLQNAPAKETTYFTVLNDGTIDYPLAGEMVQILGLTTEQIEDLLKEKIKLYENPQISIKIREHNSHNYTVLGLVEKSGEKTMQREAIPLYVVKAEAIVSSKANQAIIKRTGQETQTVDLKDSKSGDILIHPGDIIEFSTDEETANIAKVSQFYFIGGEINSGGRKDYTQAISLTQAILESGGLKKSNVKKVVIRRKNEAGLLVPTEFDLKAIKDGKAVDPVLFAGDTIEIGNL